MKEGYYTPSISEFRLGFEFETKQFTNEERSKYKWISQKWSAESSMIYLFNVKVAHGEDPKVTSVPNSIRVKYLTREDIESLGWTHVGGKFLPNSYQYFENNKNQELKLVFHPLWYEVRIYKDQMPSHGCNLFNEVLINKSEFKDELRRIQIYTP